ncbi:endo-1,4-beta-xylanase [Luteolibacter marinus]|uniref:endo-1,4-beta-xylanase n=1 Tax=Luteolibacter marinus TaxID=2776705 RepID=UPI0018676D2F|nr:endo-1,4-beta-xylanase [Luteolibacter marinus]
MRILPLLCFIGLVARVAAELSPPDGGEDLLDRGLLKVQADPAHATAREIEGGGWQLNINRPDEERPHLAQISTGIDLNALAEGEVVLAIIRARSAAGDAAVIEAKLQRSDPPYDVLAPPVPLELSGDWQELPVVYRVTAAAEKHRATLTLLCARQLQTVEVSSIRALKYPAGTDTSAFPRIRRTYEGREPGAAWREAALLRIEQLRKSDFSVRVHDADGQALVGKEVVLTLRRHEFGFGSAVTAELLTEESEDGRRYRAIVDRLFSRVVFENDLKDFGWEEGAEGRDERLARLDHAFAWLGERHIAVRGHYLMQNAVPPNLDDLTDPEAIRRHFLETAKARLDFAKDRVCEWDVVNHPVGWNGAKLFTARPGLAELDREVYGLAQRATALPFFVNEDQLFRPGRQSDETFTYLEKLKQAGFRVDGLGNQAHIDDSYLPSPMQVLEVTDRFGALAPRQAITEFDIVTADDEELAADYTRDLMIAAFSHPAYTSFILWGFWEGRHWKPDAASWTRDWTARARAEVLEEWLGRRWTTSVTLTTGKGGIVQWRGFPGWYEVRVPGDGKTGVFQVTKAVPSGTVEVP